MNCRYDGNNNYNPELLEKLKDFAIIPVCPEQLGGLTTPRPPAQITGFSIFNTVNKSNNSSVQEPAMGNKKDACIPQINHGTGEDVLDEKAQVRRIDDDVDVTAEYIRGAEQTLFIAQLFKAKKAYLKEKSPACGVNFIKKGTETVKGSGVAAAMLRIHGIQVIAV